MKIVSLILLAVAAGIHWLRCNPNRDARGRYKPNNVAERWGVYVVLAVVAVLVLAGCKSQPIPVPKAEAIRVETRAAAIDIGKAVDDGKAWIAKAHAALRVEIAKIEVTQPAPALRAVSDDLTRAEVALAPVGPATQAIAKLADEAKTETDVKAGEAKKAQDKLADERDNFWSYKQRVLFWSALAIAGLIITVLMLLRAFGGAVVAEVVSDILRAIWKGIKAVVLFPLWLIDQLNKKYDDKAGEKKQ